MTETYNIPDYMREPRKHAIEDLSAYIRRYPSKDMQDLVRGGWDSKIRHQIQAGVVAKLLRALSEKAGYHIIVYGPTSFIYTGRYLAPINNAQLEDLHFDVCEAAGLSAQQWHDESYSKAFFRAVAATSNYRSYFGEVKPRPGVLFKDGFVDINGKLHRDVKPQWLCMYEVQCNWERKRPTGTKFMQLVDHAVDGKDEKSYMLASFGNAIAGDPLNAQRALLLVGLGGTGKSTIQDAIGSVVGGHNRYDVDSIGQLAEQNGQHAGPTEYATLCIAADSSANVKKIDVIKKFISKEPVKAKELYFQPRVITPRSAIIAGSNDAQIERLLHDDGIFRRFDIIGFWNRVSEKNKDSQLHVKLAKETADIGWLVVDALVKHAKNNDMKLTRPASLLARLQNARDEGDVVSSALSQMGARIANKGGEGVWVYWPDIKANVMELAQDDGYEVKAMQIKAKLKAAGPNSQELPQPFHTNRYAYYRLEILDPDVFRSFNLKTKTF